MTRTVLLVGAGRMGGALLKGWLANGIGPLAVVEPLPSPELRKLGRSGRVDLHCAVGAISEARACLIALKPQVLQTEVARLKPLALSGALMISIAAGTKTKLFSDVLGKQARIVRAMPNIPGAIGKGISALYARRNATSADRKLADRLLAALGETLWVGRESLIDSVTAVSGSGPAYVFLLAEALADAARAEGLSDRQAQQLARATVVGAGALLDEEDLPMLEFRRKVTSPAGTTEAALNVLLGKDGLKPLLARAVRAARRRAEELGR